MNVKHFQAAIARSGEPRSIVELVGKHAEAVVKEFNKRAKQPGVDNITALKTAFREALPLEAKRVADQLALRSGLILDLVAEEAAGQKSADNTKGAEA